MRRDARAAIHEERWVTNLKKALVRAGVTVDKIAGAIAGALDAERLASGEDGEVVNLGPHHTIRLKAAAMAVELHTPLRMGQLDAARPILNIQAGAKVQLVFFGEAIEPTPEAPGVTVPSTPASTPVSAELKAHLVRSGRLLPDGTVPETAKVIEVTKALPEGKARERGEGWVK